MFTKLLIATTNQKKLIEIKRYFNDLPFEVLCLADLPETYIDPEETEVTLEGNSLLKAKFYGEKTGLVTVADDSGLFLHSEDGWPGVFSARIGKDDDERRQLVLDRLEGKLGKDREASFRCCVTVYNPMNKSHFSAIGMEVGSVVEASDMVVKEGDFCYNSLFWVPDLEKTYSQLTIDERNERSHRGEALQQVKYFLMNQYGAKNIPSSVACIVRDGKLLLAMRNDPHRPEFHKKWELPGGGVDFGETLEQAVVREVKEETGFDISVQKRLDYIHQLSSEGESWRYNLFLVPFLCEVTGGEEDFSEGEVLKLQWFDFDEVLGLELVGEDKRLYEEVLRLIRMS